MPRSLVVPLKGRPLPGTTLIRVWADLPLFVRTDQNVFVAVEFRYDTGANVTEVGSDWARQQQIPINGPAVT